jgi:uncharacterized coiled-coil DUF342 family protein
MRATTIMIPDTHVLRVLAQEYEQMLVKAQRGVKKLLSLDPQEEEFWDQLSELDPTITLIESRSNSIHQEIDDLVDQLPDD